MSVEIIGFSQHVGMVKAAFFCIPKACEQREERGGCTQGAASMLGN